MSDYFALFIWINDVPIRGSVLKMTTIVQPRCGYDEYKVGQRVTVRCPGMGKFEAVIGRIGDAKQKKEMEQIFQNGKEFEELLASLQLNVGAQSDKSSVSETSENNDNQHPQTKSSKTEHSSEKNNQSTVKSTKKKENQANKLSTAEHPQEKKSKKEEIHREGSPKKFDGSDDCKLIQKATQSVTKVVKPKPVKRKVAFNDGSEALKERKLEQAAEDMALCDLSLNRNEENDTSTLLGKSMAVLADSPYKHSPRRSPRHHSSQTGYGHHSLQTGYEHHSLQTGYGHHSLQTGYDHHSPERSQSQQTPHKCCDHQFEILSLKSSVANLEYWCRTMWDDIMTLKSEAARKQSGANYNFQTMLGHSANAQNESPGAENSPAVQLPTTSTPIQSEAYLSPASAASAVTHRGFTKEQVMAELSFQKNYKKGTSRLFRMLFSEEERTGRSLNGQKGCNSEVRPALENREKLKFLEDCVKEQWRDCSLDEIRTVIRHILKPSRNTKKGLMNNTV